MPQVIDLPCIAGILKRPRLEIGQQGKRVEWDSYMDYGLLPVGADQQELGRSAGIGVGGGNAIIRGS